MREAEAREREAGEHVERGREPRVHPEHRGDHRLALRDARHVADVLEHLERGEAGERVRELRREAPEAEVGALAAAAGARFVPVDQVRDHRRRERDVVAERDAAEHEDQP